jgi:hypothetical protein
MVIMEPLKQRTVGGQLLERNVCQLVTGDWTFSGERAWTICLHNVIMTVEENSETFFMGNADWSSDFLCNVLVLFSCMFVSMQNEDKMLESIRILFIYSCIFFYNLEELHCG